MKTIQVNQDELIKYIVKNCNNYFYNYVEGECCLRKVEKETCNLHVFSESLHCPLDCPRISTKAHGCDKGRCPHVKAVLKQLKA